ncbi:MAG TPA: hypothetical protein VLZ03_00045, partial [Thermodesulfobacteriota bacterium]|nr:hypothetical protein [Thermodesulfobacteriota bacterium]
DCGERAFGTDEEVKGVIRRTKNGALATNPVRQSEGCQRFKLPAAGHLPMPYPSCPCNDRLCDLSKILF